MMNQRNLRHNHHFVTYSTSKSFILYGSDRPNVNNMRIGLSKSNTMIML